MPCLLSGTQPYSKRVKNQLLPIIDLLPLHASCVRLWSTCHLPDWLNLVKKCDSDNLTDFRHGSLNGIWSFNPPSVRVASFRDPIQTQYTLHGQLLGFIKRNVKTETPQIREMAYQSFVRPQLKYASAVWEPHTKDKTKSRNSPKTCNPMELKRSCQDN